MQYAGGWQRFNASVIDGMIVGAVLFVISLMTSANIDLMSLLGLGGEDDTREKLLGIAIAFIYSVLFMGSSWQATPGMRWRKIYVIKPDGESVNYINAVCRFLAFSAPLVFDFMDFGGASVMGYIAYIAWYVPIIYTREKTGVHDMICSTRVVRGKPDFTASILLPTPPSL